MQVDKRNLELGEGGELAGRGGGGDYKDYSLQNRDNQGWQGKAGAKQRGREGQSSHT